jgi:Tol biopolymer transport system component
MSRRAVLGFVLGLALTACEPGAEPGPNPTTASSRPPTPTISSANLCAHHDAASRLVAYTDARDLWLYDVRKDERRRLTSDGEARYEHEPKFLGSDCLVYANSEPAAIELLDLSGAAPSRRIVEERGLVVDLDVSPDGSTVLYLQINFDVDSTYRLKQVGIEGGTPVVLHTFAQNPGRGAGSEDEVSVAWAPDGSKILVINTHEGSKRPKAISLFDRTGREVVGQWTGTHPRWSPDGRTIYYRGYAGLNGQDWYALDVRTMKAVKLGIRPATNRLAVSPDGVRVAYDTSYFGEYPLEAKVSDEAPVTYVYNLATRKETLLKEGALEPLWVSVGRVLVTNAKKRPRNSLNSWESLGTVTEISIDGTHTMVAITSTLFDSDVYLGK